MKPMIRIHTVFHPHNMLPSRHEIHLSCTTGLSVKEKVDIAFTASSIPAWSHTLAEIDHEIISTAILLACADSRRVVVSYKRKYVHKVLVNCLQ